MQTTHMHCTLLAGDTMQTTHMHCILLVGDTMQTTHMHCILLISVIKPEYSPAIIIVKHTHPAIHSKLSTCYISRWINFINVSCTLVL